MVHVRGVITSQRSRRTTRLHFGTLCPVRDIVLTLFSTHLARKKKIDTGHQNSKVCGTAENWPRTCVYALVRPKIELLPKMAILA